MQCPLVARKQQICDSVQEMSLRHSVVHFPGCHTVGDGKGRRQKHEHKTLVIMLQKPPRQNIQIFLNCHMPLHSLEGTGPAV